VATTRLGWPGAARDARLVDVRLVARIAVDDRREH
jgi:hypothetical protein